jgi:L-alanine-DL-glutamate epimerase-like enolase superfamily enzyme
MMTRRLSLSVTVERWPIAGSFAISRGSKTEAVVVVAELGDGKARGRGECVPYARYGETVEGVAETIESLRPRLATGLDRAGLQTALPPGAARNALDCAFWDLQAKASGRSAADLAGLPTLEPLTTAYTISIGTPEEMARAAAREAHRPLLKVKLGRDGDPARILAVRSAAPNATLIVDANEGWDERTLEGNLAACAEAGVTLLEQPLPDGRDGALARITRPIAVCADESAHARDSLAGLTDRYDAVNVKLDKAGGLTEALAMAAEAERLGLKLMVGCMVATSLAMAPALLVAQRAAVVDLDGPLLLAKDRPDALHYAGSRVDPPSRALWG